MAPGFDAFTDGREIWLGYGIALGEIAEVVLHAVAHCDQFARGLPIGFGHAADSERQRDANEYAPRHRHRFRTPSPGRPRSSPTASGAADLTGQVP
ncbi:MAG: hypothetical protein U0360_09615 [Dehalococcoidia bacterium]